MRSRQRFVVVVAVLAAAFFLVTGVWAFLAPANFFAKMAAFPPYNRHFLHDVGALSIGLGLAVLLALRFKDALFVVLAGLGVAGVLHAVAHVMDRNLGGRGSDPYTLGVFGLLMVAGAVVRAREVTR